MKEELHTEEVAHTEPEATTSDASKPQVGSHSRLLQFLVLITPFIIVFHVGGKIVLHYIKKHTKGTGMQGVKVARPNDFRRMTSSKRTVSRAYGGILTGTEVKDRIMRAFFIEEFKKWRSISKTTTEKKDKKKKKKSTKK